MGANNFEAWNVKSSIAAVQKFGVHDPILAHGILLRRNSNRLFDTPPIAEKFELKQRSTFEDKPVSLPNPFLYLKLSQLNFSGDDADSFSESMFNDTIIPLVEPIYRDFLDIGKAHFVPRM